MGARRDGGWVGRWTEKEGGREGQGDGSKEGRVGGKDSKRRKARGYERKEG